MTGPPPPNLAARAMDKGLPPLPPREPFTTTAALQSAAHASAPASAPAPTVTPPPTHAPAVPAPAPPLPPRSALSMSRTPPMPSATLADTSRTMYIVQMDERQVNLPIIDALMARKLPAIPQADSNPSLVDLANAPTGSSSDPSAAHAPAVESVSGATASSTASDSNHAKTAAETNANSGVVSPVHRQSILSTDNDDNNTDQDEQDEDDKETVAVVTALLDHTLQRRHTLRRMNSSMHAVTQQAAQGHQHRPSQPQPQAAPEQAQEATGTAKDDSLGRESNYSLSTLGPGVLPTVDRTHGPQRVLTEYVEAHHDESLPTVLASGATSPAAVDNQSQSSSQQQQEQQQLPDAVFFAPIPDSSGTIASETSAYYLNASPEHNHDALTATSGFYLADAMGGDSEQYAAEMNGADDDTATLNTVMATTANHSVVSLIPPSSSSQQQPFVAVAAPTSDEAKVYLRALELLQSPPTKHTSLDRSAVAPSATEPQSLDALIATAAQSAVSLPLPPSLPDSSTATPTSPLTSQPLPSPTPTPIPPPPQDPAFMDDGRSAVFQQAVDLLRILTSASSSTDVSRGDGGGTPPPQLSPEHVAMLQAMTASATAGVYSPPANAGVLSGAGPGGSPQSTHSPMGQAEVEAQFEALAIEGDDDEGQGQAAVEEVQPGSEASVSSRLSQFPVLPEAPPNVGSMDRDVESPPVSTGEETQKTSPLDKFPRLPEAPPANAPPSPAPVAEPPALVPLPVTTTSPQSVSPVQVQPPPQQQQHPELLSQQFYNQQQAVQPATPKRASLDNSPATSASSTASTTPTHAGPAHTQAHHPAGAPAVRAFRPAVVSHTPIGGPGQNLASPPSAFAQLQQAGQVPPQQQPIQAQPQQQAQQQQRPVSAMPQMQQPVYQQPQQQPAAVGGMPAIQVMPRPASYYGNVPAAGPVPAQGQGQGYPPVPQLQHQLKHHHQQQQFMQPQQPPFAQPQQPQQQMSPLVQPQHPPRHPSPLASPAHRPTTPGSISGGSDSGSAHVPRVASRLSTASVSSTSNPAAAGPTSPLAAGSPATPQSAPPTAMHPLVMGPNSVPLIQTAPGQMHRPSTPVMPSPGGPGTGTAQRAMSMYAGSPTTPGGTPRPVFIRPLAPGQPLPPGVRPVMIGPNGSPVSALPPGVRPVMVVRPASPAAGMSPVGPGQQMMINAQGQPVMVRPVYVQRPPMQPHMGYSMRPATPPQPHQEEEDDGTVIIKFAPSREEKAAQEAAKAAAAAAAAAQQQQQARAMSMYAGPAPSMYGAPQPHVYGAMPPPRPVMVMGPNGPMQVMQQPMYAPQQMRPAPAVVMGLNGQLQYAMPPPQQQQQMHMGYPGMQQQPQQPQMMMGMPPPPQTMSPSPNQPPAAAGPPHAFPSSTLSSTTAGSAPSAGTRTSMVAAVAPPKPPSIVSETDIQAKRDATAKDAAAQTDFARWLLREAARLPADRPSLQDQKHRMFDEAFAIMKTCAEPHAGGGKGYPDAQFFLAECYRKGAFGSVKNLDKAFALYTKASKLGHAPSAYYRGLAFELGLGTKVNEKKALELFRTAASAGVTAAALKLGVVYQRGLLKQKPNEATALLWLKRAAADAATAAQVVATATTGDDDPTGTDQQDENAKALKLAALASRNVYALHACWLLGMHYEKSTKPEEREAAFHFFLDAAELQYPPAAFKVAMCLRDGVGVDADHEQAAQWFEVAKANGVSNLAQITNLPLPT